jgi:hypothetical protein
MIRSFDLRDMPLVRRLTENGTPLHTESALVTGLHPLRSALLSMVGGEFPTFVWKASGDKKAGFIQLQVEGDEHHAHILFLGAVNGKKDENGSNGESAVLEDVWLPLLDTAVTEVGRRGVHSLVAEVAETGKELPVLRRAGFAVYTRQDIWVYKGEQKEKRPSQSILKPRQANDDWDIQLLYANTVPRLVQLVEPEPPLKHGEIWVLRESEEMTAFAHFHTGSEATWLRFFIHPNAETLADVMMQEAVQIITAKTSRPIYCCVRRYQSWLQNPLQRAGFTYWGSQAVLVKRTVHQAQKPAQDLTAVLETQGITPSAPIVQRYKSK